MERHFVEMIILGDKAHPSWWSRIKIHAQKVTLLQSMVKCTEIPLAPWTSMNCSSNKIVRHIRQPEKNFESVWFQDSQSSIGQTNLAFNPLWLLLMRKSQIEGQRQHPEFNCWIENLIPARHRLNYTNDLQRRQWKISSKVPDPALVSLSMFNIYKYIFHSNKKQYFLLN